MACRGSGVRVSLAPLNFHSRSLAYELVGILFAQACYGMPLPNRALLLYLLLYG